MRSKDAADCCAGETTGLAEAVLCEIAALLARFAGTGEAGAIDLRGLPMTEADRARLESRLGHGEVRAEVVVAGRSEVWETSYAGVWWVRHRGADDRVAAEEIVVTRVPDILATHEDDVRAASMRLANDLANPERAAQEEETSHV